MDAVSITSGIDTIVDVFSKTVTLITGNSLLLAFVGASLLCLGFTVFRKAKKSVKG